jgi:hypothetical protein
MQSRTLTLFAALALGAACSSSSKETRTASAETSASQPANGTPTNERPSADSANVPPPVSGQAMPEPSPRFLGGKVASVDPANDRFTVNQPGGPDVVIIVSRDADFVDSNGQTLSQGLTGLDEGDQVRVSLDPSSHKADRVEVTKNPQPSPQPSR